MSVRFRRNTAIEAAPLQQELMLFNASTNKFCMLNATAAHVWQRLDQPQTEDELVESLCSQFKANERGTVERDLRAVLKEMESLDLVSREA